MPSEPDITFEECKTLEDKFSITPLENKNCVGKQKNHRKRHRKHFNAIRELMEFYFGDANLLKDRFLMQMISKSPFVPLEVFLTFNKMKAITNSVEDIAKSLSNSQLLELDETQQNVRRKTEIPREREVDHKTLYVESLPPTADHDWVKEKFSRFGNVLYISLPKYSKSKKIKEFGFVEFEEESSVEKAVKAFKEFSGVLSIQDTDPADLGSVKAFIREQNNETDVNNQIEEETATNTPTEKNKKNKKRRHLETESSDAPPVAKRAKEEVIDLVTGEVQTSSAPEDGDTVDESDTVGGDEAISKKKRRKKKKKSKIKAKEKEKATSAEAEFLEMKILPKKDWKRLRNKYLNLQREKIAELKRSAWKENPRNVSGSETIDIAKPKHVDRKIQKMNMNFYGAGAGSECDDNNTLDSQSKSEQIKDRTEKYRALEKPPLFSYEPGLIVEVGFLEPCVTLKEFKADMRQYEFVKYVDIKEGAMQAYLRLENPTAAQDFVKQVSCAEYNCKVLAGELENEYWNKIKLDREMKFTKKVKFPQKRGREKIKKIITKHLRFGDDDQ